MALVMALCFLAGVVGWRIGRGSDPDQDSADIGFLVDMISHHEQAILMSTTELLDGDERRVKVFADEIVRFQSYEIGLMEEHLRRLGGTRYEPPAEAMAWMGHPVPRDEMPGLASDAEMALLGGARTDGAFVSLMIDHHAAGAAMAEAAVERVADGRVRALAARMAKAQRAEITELTAVAERTGLEVPAAGVEMDVYGTDDDTEHMSQP